MTVRVTLTEPALRSARAWLEAHPGAVLELRAGIAEADDRFELLAPAAGGGVPPATLRIGELSPGLEGITHRFWQRFDVPAGAPPRADLALWPGRGCSAALLRGGRVHAIDELFVPGARLERWQPAVPPRDLHGGIPADGRFSRYAGALGGRGVHERLQALAATGVGMARLNSLLAVALAKAGVRALTLVDPDVLEAHSLDAVEAFARGSEGATKVAAVGRFLREIAPETELDELALAVDHPAAVRACAASDLVFSAPDDDRARLVAALCATAYHRVHLDVGSGVFDETRGRVAGCDVRLIVPGDGCLLCVGGLALERRRDPDWRRQRAGSLRSLNTLATSLAMLLLEKLLRGDVQGSTWLQAHVDDHAGVEVRTMPHARDAGCVLCRRAGLGDAALGDAARAS